MTTDTQRAAEATDLLQHLIRNGCVNDGTPDSGQEERSADLLESYLEGSGVELETYEPAPGRTSLVAKLAGSDPSAPSLTLLGHTDVVPANPSDWTHDPFGGELIDGEVWGRGAIDMLNLTTTMATGIRHLALSGFRPRGDLTYIAVADEEALSTYGARWLCANAADDIRTDYVITESGGFPMNGADGLPRLPVIVGEKGVFWCILTVTGTPGHASQPLRTDNALVKAAEVVRRIDEYRPQAELHEAWTRFIAGLGLPARAVRAAARPGPHRRLLRRAAAARPRPPGPRLHPHHHGPDRHAGRHQDQRDPRPGRARGRHPGAAGMGDRRRAGHARGRRSATWPTTSRSPSRPRSRPPPRPSTPRCGTPSSGSARSSTPGRRPCPFLTVGATDARYTRTLGSVSYGFGLHSTAIGFEQYGAMFHGIDERVDVESLRLSTEMWMALARDFLA